MMDKKAQSIKIDTVYIMIIFCFFMASVLTVLALGGNVYKNITERSQEGYDERICLSYIWTKVKNGDKPGKVYVSDFCGLTALYLDEEYEGVSYNTIIYLYNGWVHELFCEKSPEMSPEDGMPVIKAEKLDFEQTGEGLIEARINYAIIYIFPRGVDTTYGYSP